MIVYHTRVASKPPRELAHPSLTLSDVMKNIIGYAIFVCLWSHLLVGATIVTAATQWADLAPIHLDSFNAGYQILVDRQSEAGYLEDQTAQTQFQSLSPAIATVTADGYVRARSDGETQIRMTIGDRESLLRVSVTGTSTPLNWDFERDVIPYLTRYGCNGSACHGKAEGQNGLKFSVFGFDPQADYDALVRDSRGRRVNVTAPSLSLFLLKGTQTLPHVGGQRIQPDSPAYEMLQAWVKAGAPFESADRSPISRIEISPGERRLRTEAVQQLRVTVIYENGQRQDVTRLARYRSNNEGLATVDENGRITIGTSPGQVAIMASYLGAVDTFVSYIPRNETIESYPTLAENNFVDRFVNQNLKKLNLLPSEPASDADFLRRVYIDIIGTLPTATEARDFLTDSDPQKRLRLVDQLLDRPEYATYWALKWSDLLRVDRSVLGHRRAYAYYRWIRDSLRNNRPMNEFAREIVTADGLLDESPQGGFFQAIVEPGDRASAFSQVFLGVRIDCAECHHHPFDRWSQHDYYGMTAFFSQVKSEPAPTGDALVLDTSVKTTIPRTGMEVSAQPLGASTDDAEAWTSRRKLADWLTHPENPWFARNLANRLWAHLLGQGLVNPVDDVRQTNPSSNQLLLDRLANHLVEQHYDAKALIRVITASRAYQRSSKPNDTNENDSQNASRALLKPVDAEVLLDAVSQTTGIPAQFAGAPSGLRAIELWDSNQQHPFLRLFGRPERKTACECERASEPSVGQVLHTMNSPEIYKKLNHEGGQVAKLVRQHRSDNDLAEELYLTFLSRFPSDSERKVIREYLAAHHGSRRDAAVDLAWSLINTLEFSFNH